MSNALSKFEVKQRIDAERKRCHQILAARTERPGMAFWLSFADDNGFRGVVIIHGEDFMTAVLDASIRHINPGGEVRGMEIHPEVALTIPERWKNRLLTRSDCAVLEDEMTKTQTPQ